MSQLDLQTNLATALCHSTVSNILEVKSFDHLNRQWNLDFKSPTVSNLYQSSFEQARWNESIGAWMGKQTVPPPPASQQSLKLFPWEFRDKKKMDAMDSQEKVLFAAGN